MFRLAHLRGGNGATLAKAFVCGEEPGQSEYFRECDMLRGTCPARHPCNA